MFPAEAQLNTTLSRSSQARKEMDLRRVPLQQRLDKSQPTSAYMYRSHLAPLVRRLSARALTEPRKEEAVLEGASTLSTMR
jgi:hypothetical protein